MSHTASTPVTTGTPTNTGAITPTGQPVEALPHPVVGVVGERSDREAVAELRQWAELGVVLVHVDDIRALPDDVQAVLVLSRDGDPRAAARRSIALHRAPTPVLLLVERGSIDDDDAAQLYQLGVAAVVAWPDEAPLLPALVASLVGRDGLPPASGALESAVQARLAADPVLGNFAMRLLGTTVVVHGGVGSAWERERLRRLLATVPGISRVVDHGVLVRHPDVADEQLLATAREMACAVGNAEGRDLVVDVRHAIATLSGAAPTHAVVERVGNALQRIPGIQRVRDDVTIEGD